MHISEKFLPADPQAGRKSVSHELTSITNIKQQRNSNNNNYTSFKMGSFIAVQTACQGKYW